MGSALLGTYRTSILKRIGWKCFGGFFNDGLEFGCFIYLLRRLECLPVPTARGTNALMNAAANS